MLFKTAFLAIAIAVLGVSSASAVDLKPCNTMKDTNERLKCLEYNIVLLNSSHEFVARELRASAASQQDEIAKLREMIANIKPAQPDLSNYLQYGSKVQLQSSAWGGTCLDHDTSNAGHIQGWGCNTSGAQDWVLVRR